MMLTPQECSVRAAELNKIIEELWDSDPSHPGDYEKYYRTYIDRLKNVYLSKNERSEYYRHRYSGILGKLIELKARPNTDFERLSGRLLDHFDRILEMIRKLDDTFLEKEKLEQQVGKLYDHINLEVCRLGYTDQIESKIKDTKGTLLTNLQNLNEQIDTCQNQVEIFDKKYGKYKQKIKGLQKETITILGLFSAVVLVFMSGVSFSSSVLQSMQNSSVFKVAAISLLIGFVLLSIIFLLFKFILYVNKINIDKSSSRLTRFDITFMIIGGILLIMLLIVIVFWCRHTNT